MSNYKGQLKGFPSEVVEKMLERQVEQGNKRDVGVFEKIDNAGKYHGGFGWAITAEGADFWREVIGKRNFNLFFSRYPKEDKFTPISEDTGKKITEAVEAMREIQQKIAMNIKKADELLNFTSNSNMGELTFSSKWQPKEGDVVTIESPRGITISIYEGGNLIGGSTFYAYAMMYYDGKFYTNTAILVSENTYSIRPATYKERCIFFSRLVNEGYKWNAKKLKLTKWVPKDGDFLYTPVNSVVIYKSGAPAIITYCGINFFGDLDTNTGIGFGYIDGCRKATDSERQRLLDALRKEGKRWNAEKKRVEDIGPEYRRSAKIGAVGPLKWKPKRNEMYYFVELHSKNLYSYKTWKDDEFDNTCYNRGIIFRTDEEAISCAQKMLKK